MSDSDIVTRASEHVKALLDGKLPAWMVYHTYHHAAETVEACKEIGNASRLSASDLEIVLLAAWLHDVGYTETTQGHELRSADLATRFLRDSEYTRAGIDKVTQCILATDPTRSPETLLEKVLCDADIINLGKEDFFKKNALLRLETEKATGTAFTDRDWLRKSVEFVSTHDFHTPYARTEFGRRRKKNLQTLDDMLRKADSEPVDTNPEL